MLSLPLSLAQMTDQGRLSALSWRIHGYENGEFPVVPEFAGDLLFLMDPYKSMGPDRIHVRMLSLAEAVERPLSNHDSE